MKADLTHHPDLIECLAAGTLPDDPFASGRVMTDAPVVVSLKGAIQDALLHSTASAKDKSKQFVSTGIQCIDNRFGLGLEKGTSTIVGGYTSTGKSTLALGFANASISRGGAALIISLEDSARLYGRRMLSMRTGIPARVLRCGGLSPDQLAKCSDVVESVEDIPFFIDAKEWSAEKMSLAIRWAVRFYPAIELVIIDYLQELPSAGANSVAEGLAASMKTLRNTISKLDVAGVFLSQLTGDRNMVPNEYNIRDSKTIANAADNIMLLWRNRTEEVIDVSHIAGRHLTVPLGGTLLVVPKVKDGGEVGAELLDFRKESQQFFDPDAGDYSGFAGGFDEKEEYFDDGF